ncbi:hypothetical protein T484DRAFT_1891682 [Baffinella frigidus]|nr:hypothetical protein T484DRAFT_1891682 [Cryptophyta sp. CCMP2293]
MPVGFAKLARRIGSVVFDTPLDHLWLSSDSPDTIPASLGGGRRSVSHPGGAHEVASKIAEIKGLGEPEVLEALRRTIQAFLPSETLDVASGRAAQAEQGPPVAALNMAALKTALPGDGPASGGVEAGGSDVPPEGS